MKDFDDKESITITYVEYKLGIQIDNSYPLMKFLEQAKNLRYIIQQEQKTENGN